MKNKMNKKKNETKENTDGAREKDRATERNWIHLIFFHSDVDTEYFSHTRSIYWNRYAARNEQWTHRHRTDLYFLLVLVTWLHQNVAAPAVAAAKKSYKIKWKRDPLLLSIHVRLVASTRTHLYHTLIFFIVPLRLCIAFWLQQTSPLFGNHSYRIVFVGLQRRQQYHHWLFIVRLCALERDKYSDICIHSIYHLYCCWACVARWKRTYIIHIHAWMKWTHAEISSAYYAWIYISFFFFFQMVFVLFCTNPVPSKWKSQCKMSTNNMCIGKLLAQSS